MEKGKRGKGGDEEGVVMRYVSFGDSNLLPSVCAQVYSFGNGSGVGKGTTEPRQYTPWMVEALEGEMIIDIGTGDGHCLALTQSEEHVDVCILLHVLVLFHFASCSMRPNFSLSFLLCPCHLLSPTLLPLPSPLLSSPTYSPFLVSHSLLFLLPLSLPLLTSLPPSLSPSFPPSLPPSLSSPPSLPPSPHLPPSLHPSLPPSPSQEERCMRGVPTVWDSVVRDTAMAPSLHPRR